MRLAHKVWIGIAASVFVLVAIGDLAGGSEPSASLREASSMASAETPVAAAQSPVYSPAPAPAPQPVGEQVTIRSVYDGDTFTTTDGVKVRVLGIDSCEMSTGAGPAARDYARSLMPVGSTVTLSREPGVDTDQNDRALRYVALAGGGGDLASRMVYQRHTGVYEGANDASDAYVAELRRLDLDGRACSRSGAGSATAGDVECSDFDSQQDAQDHLDADPSDPARLDVDDDGVACESLPGGSTGSSTGNVPEFDVDSPNVNLPDGALTGGYCARKWWC